MRPKVGEVSYARVTEIDTNLVRIKRIVYDGEAWRFDPPLEVAAGGVRVDYPVKPSVRATVAENH